LDECQAGLIGRFLQTHEQWTATVVQILGQIVDGAECRIEIFRRGLQRTIEIPRCGSQRNQRRLQVRRIKQIRGSIPRIGDRLGKFDYIDLVKFCERSRDSFLDLLKIGRNCWDFRIRPASRLKRQVHLRPRMKVEIDKQQSCQQALRRELCAQPLLD